MPLVSMLVNVFLYIAPLCFTLQVQQSHRMVIFAAILILMTLFILYSSNNNSSIDAVYASFHVATNHATKTTDLRKWTGKDGYVPVYGNKVGCAQTLKVKAGTIVNFEPEINIESVSRLLMRVKLI